MTKTNEVNEIFEYVPNLPTFTIPEEYEWINRFHKDSYNGYTVTRCGNVKDGPNTVTVYEVSKDDHTVYVLSDFYDGSYWCREN
jgi:hypothetical protein